MLMTCKQLVAAYLETCQNGFRCRTDGQGRLCLVTPYLYPDHDFIEVFVRERGDGWVVVSDLGETARQLDSAGIDICGDATHKYTAEKVASGLGIQIESGILIARGLPEKVGEMLFRVLTAAKLVSSLALGTRAYRPATFDDEVKELFKAKGVEFESKVDVAAGNGKVYTIRFRANAPRGRYLIHPVSPSSRKSSKQPVDAAVRMWLDIGQHSPSGTPVTLLNDQSFRFRREDLSSLSQVSRVFTWSDRDLLIEELTGAALAS